VNDLSVFILRGNVNVSEDLSQRVQVIDMAGEPS
jgi:hypothetical protein